MGGEYRLITNHKTGILAVDGDDVVGTENGVVWRIPAVDAIVSKGFGGWSVSAGGWSRKHYIKDPDHPDGLLPLAQFVNEAPFRARQAAAQAAELAAKVEVAREAIRVQREAEVLEKVVVQTDCAHCGAPPAPRGQPCRYCGTVAP